MNLPDRIETPASWYGPAISADAELWTHRLSAGEIAELIEQADAFVALESGLAQITAEGFPLPELSKKLKSLQSDLINGCGFALIKGVPVDILTREMAATVFCGIGAHLGAARSQNAMGHILGHVRDIGKDPDDPETRIYQTHERQTFHTDGSDVVALLCLKDALEGGESLLVSAETVFNEMQAVRPDLVELLAQPIATDRRGEVPVGENPWFDIPVFCWHAGRLTVQYQRQYIDSAQRFAGAPRLTQAHIEALDLFDTLLNDKRLNFKMRLEPGDMQFVYNHALLHDRTGFTDHQDEDRKRHLLRLWLSIPGDRQLPDVYRQRYGSIKPGDRGGIVVAGAVPNAPLVPV